MGRKTSWTKDTLLSAVCEEMVRLAEDGMGPSVSTWNARRADGLPSGSYLRGLYGNWITLIEAAGLAVKRSSPRHGRVGLADDLSIHVANGATPAKWMDRYSNTFTVPDVPHRVEVVRGRTIGGEQCLIYREYRRIR